MDKTAEIISFDDAVVRLKGINYASIFRNHRNLRKAGLLINGVYQNTKKGSLSAA
jgi:hypothetical protein